MTDTGILEFQFVLKGRGRRISEIRESLLALSELLSSQGVKQEKTIDLDLFVLSLDIQSKKLIYFDSLIAASALFLDGVVVGDDEAFDQVPNLKRIGLE